MLANRSKYAMQFKAASALLERHTSKYDVPPLVCNRLNTDRRPKNSQEIKSEALACRQIETANGEHLCFLVEHFR